MRITDEYVFFWREKFSNWSIGQFVVNNIIFNCGEQYMMYKKATLFDDFYISGEILGEKQPSEQKKLGRKVSNYDDELWSKVRKEIVKYGLRERFKQVKGLRESLISYGNRTFVEASPYDKIWGIGMDENHPDILDSRNWKGYNLLGQILTEIKDELK
jgi:ribA/ribD-fused uncharacterized protein